jgi:aryl sulfotransferase
VTRRSRDEGTSQVRGASRWPASYSRRGTRLDGIPLDPRATYIVMASHLLDMAVSLSRQGSNIDRARMRELTGQPEPARLRPPRPPVHDWLPRWIARDPDPREQPDSLPRVMWHLDDA